MTCTSARGAKGCVGVEMLSECVHVLDLVGKEFMSLRILNELNELNSRNF